jgi:hypothetical protein
VDEAENWDTIKYSRGWKQPELVKTERVAKLLYSFPITSIVKSADGNDLFVTGVATDGSVDSDHQVVHPDWASKAIRKWLDTGGNVRVQHQGQRDPAGIGVKCWTDQNGASWVRSEIVEPTAQLLVRKGVLRAYSIGVRNPVVQRDVTGKASGGVITGGEIVELSLVDRPSNKSCGITVTKSAKGLLVKTFGADLTKAEKKEAKLLQKMQQHRPSADELYNFRLAQWLNSDSAIEREAAREALRARGVIVLCQGGSTRSRRITGKPGSSLLLRGTGHLRRFSPWNAATHF